MVRYFPSREMNSCPYYFPNNDNDRPLVPHTPVFFAVSDT